MPAKEKKGKKNKSNNRRTYNTRNQSSMERQGQQLDVSTSPESQQGSGDQDQSVLNQILLELRDIKSDIRDMKSDISGIKSSLSETTTTANNALFKADSNETKIQKLEDELAKMQSEFQTMKAENSNMKEKALRTEAQERRNNLILHGCTQSGAWEKNETTLELLYDVLDKKMKLEAAKDIKIDRCHRLAFGKNKNARPIIFKVHNYPDRERIWKAIGALKGTGLWLEEDYPSEIKSRRKILEPIRQKAKFEKREAKISYDKLIIDSQPFYVNTLDQLPKSLQPEEAAIRRGDTHTGFFSASSPLSNFSPCEFQDANGIKYHSSEQFFQYHKAVAFGDQAKAKEILEATEPGVCKYIGGKIRIPDLKEWEPEAFKIMYSGCLFKFRQCEHHQNFLLSTEDTILVEANPGDKIWGVGLRLWDENLFEPVKWKGQNLLGKVLRKVRDAIKE